LGDDDYSSAMVQVSLGLGDVVFIAPHGLLIELLIAFAGEVDAGLGNLRRKAPCPWLAEKTHMSIKVMY